MARVERAELEGLLGATTVTTIHELGLRDAEDLEIFEAAREASAVVVTKERDFVDLVERLGTPPQVLWLTLGNTTNRHLRQVFGEKLQAARQARRVPERATPGGRTGP